MSNMLYACSILYKTKLPFLLVFNKTDVQDHLFAVDWMRDFEVFQDALMGAKKEEGDGEGSGYMTGLMNSMALVLDEFYQNLRVRSATTGFPFSHRQADHPNRFYLPTGGRRLGDDGRGHGRVL